MSVHAGIADKDSHLINRQCASTVSSANSPIAQPASQVCQSLAIPILWFGPFQFYLFPLIVGLLLTTLSFIFHFISSSSSSLSFNQSARSIFRSVRPLCLFGPTPIGASRTLPHFHPRFNLSSSLLVFIVTHLCFILITSMQLTNSISPFSLSESPLILQSTWYYSYRCPKKQVNQRYIFSLSFDTSSNHPNQLCISYSTSTLFFFPSSISCLSMLQLSQIRF